MASHRVLSNKKENNHRGDAVPCVTVAFWATVHRAEVWRRANGSTPRRKPI